MIKMKGNALGIYVYILLNKIYLDKNKNIDE